MGSVTKVEGQLGAPDENEKREILYEIHDSPVGGHRGMNKTTVP
jgi:hypothetical protein